MGLDPRSRDDRADRRGRHPPLLRGGCALGRRRRVSFADDSLVTSSSPKEVRSMRYIIVARDGTEVDAFARREAARPAHLKRIQPFVDRGEILVGGSILDGSDQMVG